MSTSQTRSTAHTLAALAGLARQGVRSATYYGLGEITGRLARREAPQPPNPRASSPGTPRPRPTRTALLAAVWQLMLRDAALVRQGIAPPFPTDDGSPLQWFARVRAMIADLPEAARRSAEGGAHEVRRDARVAGGTAALPDYYLQNFHYQTGGYLTEQSARLYDIQVETLFMGTASLMRRQVLQPIAESMHCPSMQTAPFLHCSASRAM